MKIKRIISIISIVVFSCLSSFCVFACNDEEEDKPTEGLIYQLIEGKKEYCVYDLGTATSTDLVIPSEYNGLPVTAIAEKAFLGEYSIKSVTLPNSIVEIGSQAFSHCESLEKVVLPNDLAEISYRTFCQCTKLENIKLPDNLKKIGPEAFSDSYRLKEIIIPDYVTYIAHKAFYACSGLTKVTIGLRTENIQPYVFDKCGQLESVVFRDTAFWRATGIAGYVKNLADSSMAASYLSGRFSYAIWEKGATE